MTRQTAGKTRRALRTMQANVGRGGPNHDLALTLAFDDNCDLLLVQEPWVHTDLENRKTKTHPGFEVFSPLTTWTSRPRVLTYVRKGRGLEPGQPIADISRDALLVALTAFNTPLLIWNIYNAPQGCEGAGEGLQAMLQHGQQPPVLAAGDFNIRHPLWDSSVTRSPRDGEDLLNWADSHGLHVANPPDTPTHQRGGTLDLAFFAHPEANCTIAPELHTTSDHETLRTTIPLQDRRTPRPGRLDYKNCDTERLLRILKPAAAVPPSQNLEKEAADIVSTLGNAVRGSCKRKKEAGVSAPWWNEACRLALQTYKRRRRTGPADEERRILRGCVRKAKRDFWSKTVRDAATLTDVYKITKWYKREAVYQTPPIQGPEGLATTPAEKSRAFQLTLLSRHLDADDIPSDTPTVPVRAIQWQDVTDSEVFAATCQVSSTSPGEDEITSAMLRAAWPAMGLRITALFRRLAREGVHPRIFKHAETVSRNGAETERMGLELIQDEPRKEEKRTREPEGASSLK